MDLALLKSDERSRLHKVILAGLIMKEGGLEYRSGHPFEYHKMYQVKIVALTLTMRGFVLSDSIAMCSPAQQRKSRHARGAAWNASPVRKVVGVGGSARSSRDLFLAAGKTASGLGL